MEFFDVRAGTAKGGAKPVVRASDKTVIISIPRDLAALSGIADSKRVKIQFGHDDQKSAVRVIADPDGKWAVRQSRKVLTLYVPEILPAAPVTASDAEFQSDQSAITIDLPPPWRLANQAVVLRPQTSPRRTNK